MSYFEVFVCSASGFRVPGNDVMSAITSLYLEVFAYGTFIPRSTSHTPDCIVEHLQADGLDTKYHSGRKAIHGFNFPTYFKKKEESLADIFFPVFPTTVVVLLSVPTLGFLYSMEQTIYNMDTYMSIDVIGHQ